MCLGFVEKFTQPREEFSTLNIISVFQNYLKICNSSLVLDLEQAARQDFYFGAKLVRGAYMEQVKRKYRPLQ